MANEIVIRKLSNGNVQIEREGETVHTSLSSQSDIIPQQYYSLIVKSYTGKQQEFTADMVDKVIRLDNTEVNISDLTTLYTELSTYFFFKAPSSSGRGDIYGTGEKAIF
jgi:hypothetical protein